MKIGPNLKKIRTDCGFSQSEVAEAVGMDVRTYRNYETNASSVNLDLLEKLAMIFKVPVTQFFDDWSSAIHHAAKVQTQTITDGGGVNSTWNKL